MRKKLLMILGGAALVGAVSIAQNIDSAGNNWSKPLGDQGGTRFSTLSQINVSNVTTLKRAWTFRTGSGRFASSPMVVDGVMYFSAPNGIFAVDGTTGQQIWKYEPPTPTAPPAAAGPLPFEGEDGQPNVARGAAPGRGGGGGGGRGGGAGTALRGPTYWPGGNGAGPRIYSTTNQGLAAIDARTGTLVTTFGENGVIPGARPTSPAVVYKNLLIAEGGNEAGKGTTVKAWDVMTGKLAWTWYTKAQPGDPNRSTWLNGSDASESSPGIWGMFTVDEERGILFVPVEKVGNDYWGGSNHGTNLYSDSLVALDAATGKMKWFRQLVHHDIWDYDIAAAPALVEVRRNGQVIPAVVQQNKMALLFIFHRETGEPIFGVEERPVPQTTAPGEWTSPTQPFPVKPPPLARNTITRAELSKVTPEHQAFCEGLWTKYNLDAAAPFVPYKPWQVGQDIVVFPGAQGGGNWHGVSYNRPLGLIITNVMNAGQWGHLEAGGGRGGAAPGGRGAAPAAGAGRAGGAAGAAAAAPAQPAAPAANAQPAPAGGRAGQPPAMGKRTPEQGRFWMSSKRWSCSEPPWGELVAVNTNTGDIAWHVPLGEFEELTALGVKPTGTPSSGAPITTAGNLVFIGATIDGYFRAFDARNGRELWKDKLTVPSQGTPTTYMGRNGKQFVVVGANGGGYFGAAAGDEVIAYTLP